MSVKKDIAAAITFLITSLLFAVVQMEGRKDALPANDGNCRVSEKVIQADQLPTSPPSEPLSRDS